MLCLCVAGPHTALAVIFNPVASTHQVVHLYLSVRVLRSLVVENYRIFPCGCAVNRTALKVLARITISYALLMGGYG